MKSFSSQKEGKSLGIAWAHFTNILALGPDLGTPESTLLQQFRLGLDVESVQFLDSTSGWSFIHLTLSKGRIVFEKILENSPYTKIYDEPPEENTDEPKQEEPCCPHTQPNEAL